MKPEARRCKCLHCKMLFMPDYRNRGRQKYCSTPECRQASQRARQERWLSKPENQDHFRGAENVQRVQEWRKANSGYWKRSPRQRIRTLQDACSAQPASIQEIAPVALPEVCPSTLQDDIVLFVRRLIAKGQDILDQPSSRSTKQNKESTLYDE